MDRNKLTCVALLQRALTVKYTPYVQLLVHKTGSSTYWFQATKPITLTSPNLYLPQRKISSIVNF